MDADRQAREMMRAHGPSRIWEGEMLTARTIIEQVRHESLAAFEETFASLQGVTDEHLTALRRASTSTASRARFPQSDDPLGQAAYAAAALRGLAEAVAALQGSEGTSVEPTKERKAS